MRAVGLDVGTTNLCALVLDLDTGSLSEVLTQPNESRINCSQGWQRLQDPDVITGCCLKALDHLLDRYDDVAAIGISGQMHGILYVDRNGKQLGPLRTWQDGRGSLIKEDGVSYAESFTRAAGVPAAGGYGLVTVLYDAANSLMPSGAKNICTIGDYLAMVICGNVKPLLHASNAAGLGGFDIAANAFLWDKLPDVINTELLPEVLRKEAIIGEYRGVPVCCAIGDNQASVFGSLGPGIRAMVNVGTGSQISSVREGPVVYNNGLECRPYIGGKFLSVGAALCGGRAYGLLRNFFAETANLLGVVSPADLYDKMDEYAEHASHEHDQLVIDTRFSGTRQNPQIRGGIGNIGMDNFTPGKLCLGVLEGICHELHALSEGFEPPLESGQMLAAGGNGIRCSSVVRAIFQRRFGMDLAVPHCREEAAFGAALIASATTRKIKLDEASALIKYD